ncbi:alkaline phosphatase family protein [Candidatus Aminicenantes bacterium AC-334-K16]|jgi:2,3-bisphosphoglycerate-independent phosphoglycerate mutase|nr:alkaline phosphatase family protein [Candidatus Aminicenantes bacterium AC-334-K16]
MSSKPINKDRLNSTPFGQAIRQAYRQGQEDEALEPLVAVDQDGRPRGRLKKGDAVIFYDLRGEREVELTQSLTEENFQAFPVTPLNLHFVTMIEYASWLKVKVAFPPEGPVRNTLSEVLSRAGKKVLKISESEKAIHVGYFMNGKLEIIFPGETRKVIPSPQDVMNYAEVPQMSAAQVTEAIIDSLDTENDLIIANYANVDVIGHIEDEAAVIKAVEVVDHELGRVVQACQEKKITLIVTSDHGTVEEWYYPDGAINTGHTRNPVPFILIDFARSRSGENSDILRPAGELIDVAPTILNLLGIKAPEEMEGTNLVINPEFISPPRAKILLLILDGWGMRKETQGNLIARARTPHFDSLWTGFPHSLLQASGEAVGMPPGTVGNSESGHLHLGAGRRILLDRVRIDKAIKDGRFFQNEAFLWAMEQASQSSRALHLLGIVSHYSSHGTIDHLFALLELARRQGVPQVFIHCLIGRRGEKPESGAIYVQKVEEKCRSLGLGEVVTVIGRFWALDREENWDRVEKTYRALVYGEGTPVRVDR